MTPRMRNMTTQVAAVACVFALFSPGDALAQFPAPPPAERSGTAPEPINAVEGTVRNVDPAGRRVEIASGLLADRGRTLDVTPGTQIHVGGRETTLSGVRTGDRVMISYRVRDGQTVTTAIKVTAQSHQKAVPAPLP